MKDWQVIRYDSLERQKIWRLPGSLTESEIEELLRRLVAHDLIQDEIVGASRPKGDPLRSSHFDRNGAGVPISFGNNPHYTAARIS
ncbi:hypothetical protein B5M44_25895 [Shinella sumterensis]|uniref:hypothetical protein n=1 Tax=Shinella sumterensis TaxID=1967501 RepID=UPI00106EABFD|nr:hypothetical protein [Shinella sumterensis]MCD1264527.1 hypothetical protein [Shinella sumterensis]TFE92824.1 hypothetical protein B5M44_25895 [Shinella sumterensis]